MLFQCLIPHHRVDSVLELTVPRLRAMGIDAVLLDVDCTLKSYRDAEVAPEVKAWLDELRASGIGICLVSNGRHSRIGRFAGTLGLPFVSKACKPFSFGCRRAVRQEAFDPRRTAMIGDQIFADIPAGRLAGLTSILVRPIRPEEEPWFTRLKRPLEQFLLRRLDHQKDEG
jgi:HAD superfamily phosphatase (TIGR01668 family)